MLYSQPKSVTKNVQLFFFLPPPLPPILSFFLLCSLHVGPDSEEVQSTFRPSFDSTGCQVNCVVTIVCVFVGFLTSQQQASVSQGRICSDNFTCCHTEIEVADQTFYLTQSQYTDTGPTSPSADPITPGAWKGSHWIANF